MACSQAPPARRISNEPANCSGSHRPRRPTHKPNRTTSGRHARVAAGVWWSSRPSFASARPALHRLLRGYPGYRRRDPARPRSHLSRRARACGGDVTCADSHQTGGNIEQCRAVSAREPIMPTGIRTVCFQARAHIRHGAGHRNRPETENPIAHRLRPAGSGFQDFRTPAGIRNSSG